MPRKCLAQFFYQKMLGASLVKGKTFLKILFILSSLVEILESTENIVIATDEIPVQGKARVIVKKDLSQIHLRDMKIRTDSKWKAKDCFIDAFDRDGYPLDFDEIEVFSDVNVGRVGIYHVRFEYRNKVAIATVEVKESRKERIESKRLLENAGYRSNSVILNKDLFKIKEPEELDGGGTKSLNLVNLGYYLSGTLLFGQRRIEKC